MHNQGLYTGEFRDSCGFGMVVQLDNQPSYKLVRSAIGSLVQMTHRGGVNADGVTGDGCGLLMQMPKAFFRAVIEEEQGITLGDLFAIAVVFLPRDSASHQALFDVIENQCQAHGLTIRCRRNVPVRPDTLGPIAEANRPEIVQYFVEPQTSKKQTADNISIADFQLQCFLAGRHIEQDGLNLGHEDFYLCSFSSETISYKGLMQPHDLEHFYPDLHDERLQVAICLFHQRFSTNTLPQWQLAQPFHMLAHNGEINTILGNRNNVKSRLPKLCNERLGDLRRFKPLLRQNYSDSASMDQVLELLIAGGMHILRAIRMLVPPAWENIENISPHHQALHHFHALHMEPWDGPAGLVVTDGRYAICLLDRNGLRPARWQLTSDKVMTLASEVGVNPPEESVKVEKKGRIGPGQIIAIDVVEGKVLTTKDIDNLLSSEHPYTQWLHENLLELDSIDQTRDNKVALAQLPLQHDSGVYAKTFGMTSEEVESYLREMLEKKQEPVGSMGDDKPMAVLSNQPRVITDYLRQMFAQVTNPPIDPLREGIVMSLTTNFGGEQTVFDESSDTTQNRLSCESPILTPGQFLVLRNGIAGFAQAEFELHYPCDGDLEQALDNLCHEVAYSVAQGTRMVVFTDRYLTRHRQPIHAALAVGAVHQHLISEGLRVETNLIVETGFVRDSHQCAVLLALGATAIYPYLAFHMASDIAEKMIENGVFSGDPCLRIQATINKGLLKIISKMGISCISSYRGSRLFEVVGLSEKVTRKSFKGMKSHIEGIGFAELHAEQLQRSSRAWLMHQPVIAGGIHKFVHGGEYHCYNPDVVTNLRLAARTGEQHYYQAFADAVNNRPVATLRDLLELQSNRQPIALEQVESLSEIIPRFDSAGMSLGALSPEAHATLAEAMNTLGARSNSGEGGEDPARYNTIQNSKIKQIASGRFGVTPAYLRSAEVLQIKIAQGAKPGEGGQLPGAKVNKLIARLRYSMPGITLISPPPHHDIYSIEDLAQLIFDLKQVNPSALVSVKLVSEPGIGTIASGVTKAYADLITVSGYDGGTAASPLNSIHNAGSPWELGLSETHQALRANGLRGKVRVQTDGGLKTGLDVVKAAILGAESFGFGTAPMIAMGCKYLRICHLNNCATGVATQDGRLRKEHFIGEAQMVTNYFKFVIEEIRNILAQLGYASIRDIIGRTDLLRQIATDHPKHRLICLDKLLYRDQTLDDTGEPYYCTSKKNPPRNASTLAKRMLHDTKHAIEKRTGGVFSYHITNADRSIGAMLSGTIAHIHGNNAMETTPLHIRLSGVAGQSFGVWNVGGLYLQLTGEANDYVGKGMTGGRIVIRPPREQADHSWPLAGNTCLYGATGGQLFIAGGAGERFAVRNSGAQAIVHSVGDHCCEYMTGGVVIVLGKTGINFGAGMTGGFAYVYDPDKTFAEQCNRELIEIERMRFSQTRHHAQFLLQMLNQYQQATGCTITKQLIKNYPVEKFNFWLVRPKASSLESLVENLKSDAA